MLFALTRDVSPTFDRCEIATLPRPPIDVAEARREHSEYKQALLQLGCHVISLPASSDLPDSVFVEDTAVVLDEFAVMARPGVASRLGETKSVREFLTPYRKTHVIEEPGTLEGGDVLRIGKSLFVGLSSRTNEAGIAQLTALVNGSGYKVTTVPIRGGLHLKSAVTRVGERQILVNPDWVDPSQFGHIEMIEVDPSEPRAANALRIGEYVLYPAHYRKTIGALKARGLKVRPLNLSEFLKADGGVSCASILFHHPPERV